MPRLPRIYLSGFRALMNAKRGTDIKLEREWIRRTGVKYRCFSFAFVCPDAFYYNYRIAAGLTASVKENVGVMMDSSAFSFWQFAKKLSGKISKGKKIMTQKDMDALREKTVDLYVKFVKENHKDWDFYANFDYVKECGPIWEMQKRLEAQGIKPTPVYHGDASIDWFKRYCDDGHKIICIGGLPVKRRSWKDNREFFDRIFKVAEGYKVGLHGFAFTSLSMMTEYPWFSVDSATWVKTAAFGQILVPDKNRNVMHCIHVSDRESVGSSNSYNNMQPDAKKSIRSFVEDAGFNFKEVRTDLYTRCTFNGWLFSNLEKFLIKNQASKPEWESTLCS